MSSVTVFDVWLAYFTKGLPFFPNYTDHGPAHISAVLRSVDALIPDVSFKELSPHDAGVLILACLLHDSAMHLAEEAANSVIRSESSKKLLKIIDQSSWATLWAAYVREGRVWEEDRFENVFGQIERFRPDGTALARDMPRETQLWDNFDRLFMGEFLRRNHPRLAHEIAVFGVPAPDGVADRLQLSVDRETADLAGIVARSHGMPLRKAVDILSEQADFVQEVRGVKAVYLMTLLRIADYLEIDASRAPKGLDAIRALRNPLSDLEWKTHQAVPVKTKHPDPEAIYVEVRPADVHTYLKALRLLRSVQNEFDLGWAVLGEIYQSKQDECWARLKLKWRRVRSNLERREKFANTVPFIPREVRLVADSSNLLKLLVLPLYGDRPTVGIRELVQNSVDSVRERLVSAKGSIEDRNRKKDVVVSVCRRGVAKHPPVDWEFWLEVDDRGTGMSVDVLSDYFLKVGASFRASEAWKSTFIDEHGRSRVLRIGYFGIGVLATFLLGDQMLVSTRDANSPVGVLCKVKLSSKELELRKVDRPVGTTIQVKISQQLAEDLIKNPSAWDWYRMASPSMIRYNWCSEGGKEIRGARYLPDLAANPPEPWRFFKTADFPAVLWTYGDAPGFVCNGMLTEVVLKWPTHIGSNFLRVPNISIADPDAKILLNLQRTQVVGEVLPFFEALAEETVRDFLAFCLVHAPKHRLRGAALPEYLIRYPGQRPATMFDRRGVSMWASTSRGSTLLHSWHLSKFAQKPCLCLVIRPGAQCLPRVPVGQYGAIFLLEGERWDSSATGVAKIAFGEFGSASSPPGLVDLKIQECQLLIPSDTIERFNDLEKVDSPE
jgi:hypothetical protein